MYIFHWLSFFTMMFGLFYCSHQQPSNAGCVSLPELSNGRIIKPTPIVYGSVARFICNDGYVLPNGSKTLTTTCRSDGTWSNTQPHCERGCLQPGFVGQAIASKYDNGYPVGYVMQYECRLGYRMSGGVATRTCLSNYSWSSPNFSCVKKSCSAPPSIRHGSVSYPSILFGGRATYSCDKGYNIVADPKNGIYLTCSTDGDSVAWRGTPPTCQVVTCSPPIKPANGGFIPVKTSYEYSDRVDFACDLGYKLSDESLARRTCNENQTWGSIPSCQVSYDCSFEDDGNKAYCGYTVSDWSQVLEFFDFRGKAGYILEASASEASLTSPVVGTNKLSCLTFYCKLNPGGQLSVRVQYIGSSIRETNDQVICDDSDYTLQNISIQVSSQSQWTITGRNVRIDQIVLASSACPGSTSTSSATPDSATAISTATDSTQTVLKSHSTHSTQLISSTPASSKTTLYNNTKGNARATEVITSLASTAIVPSETITANSATSKFQLFTSITDLVNVRLFTDRRELAKVPEASNLTTESPPSSVPEPDPLPTYALVLIGIGCALAVAGLIVGVGVGIGWISCESTSAGKPSSI